jgi:hypothetical protein
MVPNMKFFDIKLENVNKVENVNKIVFWLKHTKSLVLYKKVSRGHTGPSVNYLKRWDWIN